MRAAQGVVYVMVPLFFSLPIFYGTCESEDNLR